MTEHKFTDEDIIKALEHCGSGYKGDVAERCMGCPLDKCGESNCFDTLLHDLSLDLIKRQKAEIERLKETLDATIAGQETLQKYIDTARAEAVKEFAERLKKYYASLNGKTAAGCVEYHIDQISKEMIGGDG